MGELGVQLGQPARHVLQSFARCVVLGVLAQVAHGRGLADLFGQLALLLQ